MFDKLIDWVLGFARNLRPWIVITPAYAGTINRFGAVHRVITNDNGVMGTGFHWLWPLWIEKAYTECILTRVEDLQSQTLVTKDGKTIVAGVVVTYKVRDITKALWEIHDVFTAIQDAVLGALADAVMSSDYDTVRDGEFSDRLTAEARKLGFRYGIEIQRVRLSEFSPAKTYRLIGELPAPEKLAV